MERAVEGVQQKKCRRSRKETDGVVGKRSGTAKVFHYMARRTYNAVVLPAKQKLLRVKRSFVQPGLREYIKKDMKEKREELALRQPSVSDYVAVGSRLIAKRLLYIIGVVLPLAAIAIVLWIVPFLCSRFYTETMELNAPEMYQYTGKVCLLAPGSQRILFEGRLLDGRITGPGRLYDENGKLIYEGDFSAEMYEGNGQSYYPDGQTMYRGGFEKNCYQGYGVLYYENGAVCYMGMFENGSYEGEGKLYGEDGALRYEGGFASGKYEGAKIYP